MSRRQAGLCERPGQANRPAPLPPRGAGTSAQVSVFVCQQRFVLPLLSFSGRAVCLVVCRAGRAVCHAGRRVWAGSLNDPTTHTLEVWRDVSLCLTVTLPWRMVVLQQALCILL